MTTFTSLNLSVQTDLTGGGSATDVTDLVQSVSISLGIDQQAAATIQFVDIPTNLNNGRPLYIYGQLGAGTPPVLFNGLVDDIDYDAGGPLTVTCTEYLSRLNERWTKEVRTYSSQDSSAVIQNLVEASGIDVSLTDIQAPSGWLLGVAAPVTLALGDVPLDLVRAIDEAEPLWVTFTGANGAVKRRPIALTTPVASFTYGSAPVLAMNWGYSMRGLYNAARVTGAVYSGVPVEEVYQAASAFVPDPPQYRTKELRSYLIEDPTRAQTVAQALVAYYNAPPARLRLRCTLTPGIDPADTITTDWGGDAFVTQVTHTISATEAVTEFQGVQPIV